MGFLEKAKSLDENVELIKVLRTNTYQIGKANVLVRTASDLGKRYFFGLNYINAEEISNLDNSFVVFICGDLSQAVFLPSNLLIENLHQISHDRNGEYKINFTRDLNLVLKGKSNQLDCSQFVNNWNQKFNHRKLIEIATLRTCPKLQFSDFNSLRNIDTLWFRKTNGDFYPEYAFEVEFSTGVWSGFGRLATLREYSTKLIIVSHDTKKFNQVKNTFPEIKDRYVNINPEQIGLLYSAELNLIKMHQEFGI